MGDERRDAKKRKRDIDTQNSSNNNNFEFAQWDSASNTEDIIDVDWANEFAMNDNGDSVDIYINSGVGPTPDQSNFPGSPQTNVVEPLNHGNIPNNEHEVDVSSILDEPALDGSLEPPNPVQVDAMLNTAETVEKSVDRILASVAVDIKSSLVPMHPDFGSALLHTLRSTKSTVEEQMTMCLSLENQYVLLCHHLQHISNRLLQFRRQFIQLELYIREVEHCLSVTDYGDNVFATLLVTEQPFPATVKQHSIVDRLEARLLTGARTHLAVLGPVQAVLVEDPGTGLSGITTSSSSSSSKKSSSSAPITGNEEQLTQNVVVFNNLKFTVGTGCKPVQIKLSVAVQAIISNSQPPPMSPVGLVAPPGSPFLSHMHHQHQHQSHHHNPHLGMSGFRGQRRIIESNPSDPFIVITNTKQWGEAEGILLKKDIFKGRLDVTSQLFSNAVQRHYMQASRQPLLKPVRPLDSKAFEFFITKIGGRQFASTKKVTQKDYDSFWVWFSAVLSKVRYQKYLLQMWTIGLFWGIISKSDAERLLSPFGAGTFLLRFSERSVGSIAVAYKQSHNRICHYMIKGTDTNATGRSLPQFLRDTSSFVKFLQVSTSETFKRRVTIVDKQVALQKIGGKKKKTNEPGDKQSSYDDDIFDLDNLNI